MTTDSINTKGGAQLATPPPDGGYGWVVVAACFWLQLQVSAAYVMFGVLLLYLPASFPGVPVIIFTSINAAAVMMFAFGSLIGLVVKKFGCCPVTIIGTLLILSGFVLCQYVKSVYLLFITYGLLPGIGYACCITTSMVAVQEWFHHKRTLAVGISTVGLSVGVFIWPSLTRWLISIYGWRGSLLIVGAIQLHGLVAGTLIKPYRHHSVKSKSNSPNNFTNNFGKVNSKEAKKPLENSLYNKDQTASVQLSDSYPCSDVQVVVAGEEQHNRCISNGCSSSNHVCHMLSYPPFIMYIFGGILTVCGQIMPIAYSPVRAQHLGFTQYQAAWLVSILGLFNIPSRVFFGWLGDQPSVNRTLLYGGSSAVTGAATFISFWLTSYWSHAIYQAIVGIFHGAYNGIQAAVVVDLLGREYIAVGVGLFTISLGLPNINHITSGYVIDQTGSLNLLFVVLGLTQLLGGLLVCLVPLVRQRLGPFKMKTKTQPVHL